MEKLMNEESKKYKMRKERKKERKKKERKKERNRDTNSYEVQYKKFGKGAKDR